MSPREAYEALIASNEFEPDDAQLEAVLALDRVHHELLDHTPTNTSLLSRLFSGKSEVQPVQGLYLWGGVGRGKTWMMDTFFDGLPTRKKRRVHFHRYMQNVHESLKQLKNTSDPLEVVGEQQASEFRVLCFDEFVVEDIGDAMILSGLLSSLFSRGVTLVATSNTAPDDLYRDGLQRARFKPAIELIKQHTQVMHMPDGRDYRLRALNNAGVYQTPLDDAAADRLREIFNTVTTKPPRGAGSVNILNREIEFIDRTSGVIWFDFAAICGGPRSSHDYIEIAQLFHTVLVSNIPVMGRTNNDEARRFIEMIDEFYDRNVNFICSAASEPDSLYTDTRLAKPFERTTSRLIEMQSTDYLGREKKG